MNDLGRNSHSIFSLVALLIGISLAVTVGVGLIFWTIGLIFGIVGLVVRVAILTAVVALVWRRVTRHRYHETRY